MTMSPATSLPPRGHFENLRIVGLMGGIGSGKSRIAAGFAELGARVIDADRVAHEVLEDEELRPELEALFAPTRITRPDGSVDRGAIAARVFEAREAAKSERPALLVELEALVHPAVRSAILEKLALWNGEERRIVVVLDVPLLVEKGWHHLCDHLVFVDATEEERRRRVVEHRGWSEADWRAREGAQAPIELKRRLASTVVANHDGTASDEDEIAGVPASLAAIYRALSSPSGGESSPGHPTDGS